MNKKSYNHPIMSVDVVQQGQILCTSNFDNIDGGDLNYGGGGTGPARAPECDDWDIWGDE